MRKSTGEYLRRHLAKQADMVMAIRLPNTAFKGNANTEVTTDIVILQKRMPGQAPGAGYRLNTRFARFVNVPELMQQFRQMADIQTAEMLQLPIPKLFQGKALVVSAPATPALKAFVASLAKRAEKLKSGLVDPSEDNMLKITGEGRKAALDLRLVGIGWDYPDNKLNLAAKEIFKIWEETKEQKSAQLVFCDLSTPQQGQTRAFSAYDDLKTKLMKKGITLCS